MFNTNYMGLVAWDQGVDPYDHNQLASNIVTIDGHDHDQLAGKGKWIGKDGLAKPCITGEHIYADAVNPLVHIPTASIPQSRLADDSVGRPQLQDNAVGTDEIEDGVVTLDKLAPDVLPIGMVVLWHRADSAVLPPDNWEVMDGRAWSTIPNSMGAGGTQWNAGNIPNMRNKFALGAGLSGSAVNNPASPPAIGGLGGQHKINLVHGHTTNAHSHTVDAHSHGIPYGGGHNHRFVANTPSGASLRNIFSRDVGVPKAEGTRQALYVQEHNLSSFAGSDVQLPMETVADHNHGSVTTSVGSTTNSATVTMDNALSSETDIRPAHVGLVYIMKVN